MPSESKSALSPALDSSPASSTEALEEVVLPTDSLQEQSRKSDLYCAEMIRREKEAEQAVVN
jgi:hypothetical protein